VEAGKDDAIGVLVTAHGDELLRVAHRALRDRGLAEDAVQETFVRAWRAAERYDPERASARTWLFSILRNVVIDLHRASAARPQTADGQEPAIDSPDGVDAYERALLAWQVEEALAQLRPEHRDALVEVYYRGRPYAEVAASLGIAVGTVKSRVFYALRAMRDALDEMGWRE
jgi:RNA polymerase sigma-70 factor (ECF subfamily)